MSFKMAENYLNEVVAWERLDNVLLCAHLDLGLGVTPLLSQDIKKTSKPTLPNRGNLNLLLLGAINQS